MRKTKLLLVAFLAMLGSSVYAYDKEFEIDQKFTSIADMKGQLVSIVNEAEGKVFCFTAAQEMNYEPYTAVSPKSYSFVIEAIEGTEYYYLRPRTPDGSAYVSPWGGDYLNSQPADRSCCFVLWQDQDIKPNGSTWALEDNGDGKFAIKNIGTGLYLKDAAPAKYEEPTYFTFCTLKETQASIIAGLTEKYNEIKAKMDAVAPTQIDFTASDNLITTAATPADAEAAISSLCPLFEDYLATTAGNVDLTSFVVNPSFETGDTSGWTVKSSNDTGAKANSNGTYTINNADGSYVFNTWSKGYPISQTIEDLPNGSYQLKVLIASDQNNKVQLNANGRSEQVSASADGKVVGVDGSVNFTVLSRKATIGAEGVGECWYKVDNFRLIYLRAINSEDLAPVVADAQKIKEGTIPPAQYSALQKAITDYNKEWTSTDEYVTAIQTITNLTSEANKTISPYADFKTLKAYADDLVLAGSDNPTGQSTLSGVITTQSSNVEAATTVEAVNAAFTALKGQMTTYANSSNPLGKDAQFNITFMLTNPDLSKCEGWKPADGWYNDQKQPSQNSQVMNTNQAVAYQKDKTKFAMYEYWSNNTEPTEGYVVYQKLTLPEGTYKMAALAFAGFGGGHRYGYQTDGDHSLGSLGEGEPNITFSAGDTDGTKITTTTLDDASIEFVQKQEGEVKIGLRAHAENRSNWMGIGYVELFKVPMRAIDLDEDAAYEPQNIAGAVTLKKRLYPGWNTVVLPFGVAADILPETFGGGELYKYTGDKNGVLQFAEATAIAPHTPYLFKSNIGDGSKRTMNFDAVTISTGTPITAGTNFDFVGTYAPLNRAITENDYLLVPGKFQKGNGRNSLNAYRAYIRGKVESEARELLISIDGVTTAIEAVDGKSVDSNSPIYNLAGQRVKSAQKGLYIQGGKKFVK